MRKIIFSTIFFITILFTGVFAQERRIELVKFVKSEEEKCKISIRNARREALDGFKQLKEDGLSEDEQKRAETQVQEKIDSNVKKVESIIAEKEKEINKKD